MFFAYPENHTKIWFILQQITDFNKHL